MREYGTGSILPLTRGRWRGRLPGRAGRRLPIRRTRAEAENDLAVALALDLQPTPRGTSLAAFGRRVLQARELAGYSNAARELSRWATHVEHGLLAHETVESVRRATIARWVEALLRAHAQPGRGHQTHRRRFLSRSVVIDCLRILRAVLRTAVRDELREDNPASAVELPPAQGRSHDPWTWLRPDEVARLLEVGRGAMVERDLGGVGRHRRSVPLVSPDDLDAATVALYSGMREGELWTLHARDVDLERERLTVRYGGRKGKKLLPPKGGRIRTLVLLSPVLDAIARQLARLRERADPTGLVFPPLSRGRPGYRAPRAPTCWAGWLKAAGLDKERADPAAVVWHSLRHTFATLALAGRLPGCEGEGWRIERVSAYLGHRSIAITQRYADVAALL